MRFAPVVLCVLASLPLFGQDARVYAFTNTPPTVVESQIRQWVPEGPRVLVNAARGQVMVITDAATHARIAQWLQRVDRPPPRLLLRIRHNREWTRVAWLEGAPATLPVSFHPPPPLVAEARERLTSVTDQTPVTASVLQIRATLLRENPAMVRLTLTPAVAFGREAPHPTAVFHELTADVLVSVDQYVDLPQALSGHEFFHRFFLEQPDPDRAAIPVGMLISLQGLSFEPEPLETPEP